MVASLRSRPIAGTIGTVFGGLWAFLAAMALPPGWRAAAAAVAAVVTVVLVVMLWRSSRAAAGQAPRLFGQKAYRIAVIAELVAIYLASVALPRFGLQAYFLQAVGIIVGLHFIGLWAATRARRFLGIAAGMCALSAVAMLLPATVHGFNLRDVFTGCANALVLWLGASRAR